MPHEHRFRYMCISFFFLAVFFLSVFRDRTFFHVPERLVGPRKTFMRLRPSFVCVNICHLIIWQDTHKLLNSYWMKPCGCVVTRGWILTTRASFLKDDMFKRSKLPLTARFRHDGGAGPTELRSPGAVRNAINPDARRRQKISN